jgi:glycosyltransferase involved in cell wall biosynthesis
MTQKRRPLIIYTRDPANWTSCQSIEAQLRKSYRLAFPKRLLEISYLSSSLEEESEQIAQKIFDLKPERIVFLNYRCPASLLLALARRYSDHAMPPLYLHIYGNFTLQAAAWHELVTRIEGLPVTLIAASKRHQALLRKIFPSNRLAIRHCPFPVDTEGFHFSEKDRMRLRKEWSLSSDEILLCYAGRLTMQKNIDTLLRAFSRLCAQSTQPLRLILCGPFDDCGLPQANLLPGRGSAFFLHQHLLRLLPHEVQERILIIDRVEQPNLQKIFCAADIFVSLSTHHDEDFGIAPAEAISTGILSVLTDWGGYSDFLQRKELQTVSIPTLLTRRGIEISMATIDQALKNSIQIFRSQEKERSDRRQKLIQWLSASAVAKVIQKLHQSRTPSSISRSSRLQELAFAMSRKSLFEPISASRRLYHSIYRSYVSRKAWVGTSSEIIFENWKSQYQNLKYLVQIPKHQQPESGTMARTWPLSMKSLNPLNPIFLDQIKHPSDLRHSPTWFVRDGRNGIQRFFEKFPAPPRSLTSQILLPQKIAFKVPEAWSPLIGQYQTQTLNRPEYSGKKQLLVIWSPQHAKRPSHTKKSILRLLENRNYASFHFLKADFSDVQFDLPPDLVTNLPDVLFHGLSWVQFLGKECFQAFDVLDLTSNENCADSFLKYLIVSRGGRTVSVLEDKSVSTSPSSIRLSPYHLLRLTGVRNGIWNQIRQMGVATDSD